VNEAKQPSADIAGIEAETTDERGQKARSKSPPPTKDSSDRDKADDNAKRFSKIGSATVDSIELDDEEAY